MERKSRIIKESKRKIERNKRRRQKKNLKQRKKRKQNPSAVGSGAVTERFAHCKVDELKMICWVQLNASLTNVSVLAAV